MLAATAIRAAADAGASAAPITGAAFSGSLSIGGGSAGIRLGAPISASAAAECAFETGLDVFSVSNPYFRIDGQEFGVFAGRGRPNDWIALKDKPYRNSQGSARSLWSPQSGETGSSLLFGLSSGGVGFFTLAEAMDAAEERAPASPKETMEASFRLAGLQVAAGAGGFSGAAAASLARSPAEASGDGWRPGKAFSPADSVFGIASSARIRQEEAQAGLWIGASAGYLDTPGLAAALDGGFEIPMGRGALRDRSLMRLKIFIFGCGSVYRTPLGNPPLYDFAFDAEVALRANSFVLIAGLSMYSQSDEESSGNIHLLREHGISMLDRLFWLWRTDAVRAALDLSLDAWSLAGMVSADVGGLRGGSIVLRYAPDPGGPTGAAFGTACRAAFSRSGRAGEDDKEGEYDDEDDIDGSMAANWLEDSLAGGIDLSSIKFECSLKWGKSRPKIQIRTGRAALTLAAKKTEDDVRFFVAVELRQTFHLFDQMELSLAVKTPSGGYALDSAPAKWPNFTVECAFPVI